MESTLLHMKETHGKINRRTMLMILVFYMLLFQDTAMSQLSEPFTGYVKAPGVSGERIMLFTDRKLYCTSEKIYFMAAYTCFKEMEPFTWSSVLYVELIAWNGQKLIGLKVPLDQSGTSGVLTIPDNIFSGNYYLRAYTKWMRNFSVYDYGYQEIKIVNPFLPDFEAAPEALTGHQKPQSNRVNPADRMNGIICSASEKKYKTRQKAEVELFPAGAGSVSCDNYCISVVKVGVGDTLLSYFPAEPKPDTCSSGNIEYLPEIRGISVSGKIIEKTTRIPVENIPVYLTIPLHGEYLSVFFTNKEGRFVFTIPHMKGEHDFYIGAEVPDTLDAEIYIDNDFCNKPVALPFQAFQLNEDERELVREMMITRQLNEKYKVNLEPLKDQKNNSDNPVVFYGSAKHIFYTDKYIELPNLEEFFIELIPDVYVKYKKKIPYLKNAGTTSLSNSFPLILMDNIPVENMEFLLKTPVNRIERIEVIDKGYIVAGSRYDGLISIYSKNKDMAGMELNKNNMFFRYTLFADEEPGSPVRGFPSDNSRIPDRRNLLYWDSHIHLSTGQKTIVSFYTSDIKGDYAVAVRGYDSEDGNERCGRCFFSVE